MAIGGLAKAGFPQPMPMEEESPNGQGFFDTIRGFPPQERTMSQEDKAEIERRIKEMDIDFKEEMRKERVTLTNLGNNAWEEIRSAVRDGTLPLHNYTPTS